MHIVVVKDAVGEAVEIVERPERLRQFLVQAIAHLLRTGVIGHENGDLLALAKLAPIRRAGIAGGAVLRQARDIGHNETGGLGQAALDGVAADGLDGDIGGAVGDAGDIDPRLGLQTVQQAVEVRNEGDRRLAGHAQGNRPLEAREML